MGASTLATLSFVGTLALLASMVFTNIKRGASTATKEVIDLREKQVNALKDEIKNLELKMREDRQLADERIRQDKESFNKEIKDLTGKIGELTGTLNAKVEENKRLSDLLTNRNPEMEEFFKQCKAIFPTINELVSLMKTIDTHLTSTTRK